MEFSVLIISLGTLFMVGMYGLAKVMAVCIDDDSPKVRVI